MLGTALAPFQLLLVHFFTESGMIVVTACLFLIILGEFLDDEALVANASTWYPLLALTLYLLTYLRRRRAINASTPLLSLMDIIIH